MLVKIFEEQVKKHPHKIAIRSEKGFLTYHELNRYANRVALLIEKKCPGVGKGERVGLLFQHGVNMITTILGTLKAGCVYVPLSVEFPQNRISYMLSDSQSVLLLTHSRYREMASKLARENGIEFISIDKPGLPVPEEDKQREVKSSQLAYIMYTSGSTGRPKGVMQTHENVIYFIKNWVERFSITEMDRLTLFSSFCHDAAIPDLFTGLHTGAVLYPYSMKNREESIELTHFLERERINIWHSVPSLFSYFANTLGGEKQFQDLRLIILGGEAVREHEVRLCKKFFPNASLANLYGQTEATFVSVQIIGHEDNFERITIGTPINGTQVFVINEEGNPVEPLEPGEILVVCNHVSPGYWQQEEATRAAFGEEEGFGKLYWTGDLGCLLPEGEIEFLGRKDFQVKIRGFRIELGEIESRLLEHDNISEAVVAAREDENRDKYLCAYFVGNNPHFVPTRIKLREYLSQTLPDYMIPANFMQLESLPLTPNGKIDRKTLPEPVIQKEGPYIPPGNRIEEKLAAIWADILGLQKEIIGIHDDFFRLGGHSLRAVTLVSRIQNTFGVNIPLTIVFQHPRIKELSRIIKQAKGEEEATVIYSSIAAVEKKEYYPLSPAQQRFYIMQQLAPKSTAYNMPQVLTLSGNIDVKRLEQTFEQLIQRHEALRTSFEMLRDEPLQRIHDQVEFEIQYDGAKHEAQCIDGDKDRCAPGAVHCASFIRSFDLSQAPLLRVVLINAGDKKLLVVDLHHIISDGTSNTILVRDFQALSVGKELPPIKLQYKDFSGWQHYMICTGQWQADENYWLKRLKGRLPLLKFPSDYPRPKTRSFEGKLLRVALGQELTAKIRRFNQQTGTTLYMLLLAANTILLSRYSGQTDIIIGTPVAGRGHADLQHIIGLMIGAVMMRNFPIPRKSFLHFLEEVKTNALEAFEHQSYPYEVLLKKLDWQEEPGHDPITDMSLIVQNMPGIEAQARKTPTGKGNRNPNRNTTSTREDIRQSFHTTSKLDLTLIAWEHSGDIIITAEYCTALFKPGTIRRFTGHLVNLLENVLEEPELAISDIDITGPGEKASLIGRPVKCYPLSHAQRRIYYTGKIFPDTACNNVCFTVRYREILDKQLLEKAINYTIRGNDALRLRILEMDFQDEPLQYISVFKSYHLQEVNLKDSQLEQWLETESMKPFQSLDRDLFYFAYLKFNENESGFYMKMHHLVTDGWSRLLLARQITEIYQALAAGKTIDPIPNPSYIEYLSYERQYLNSPQAVKDRAFWHRTLLPLPEKVHLPGNSDDRKRNIQAGIRVFVLDNTLRKKIHHFCYDRGTSIFKIILSALSIYISRATGNDDMVIGSFNHNRAAENQWNTVGMFVSTIPLRIKIHNRDTFACFLEKLGKQVNHILKNHQAYPFDWLSLELNEMTNVDPGYLMDINLIGHPDLREDQFRLKYHFPGYEPNLLSLHININNKDIHGILELEWYYHVQEFSREDIQQMHRYLVNILEDALNSPEKQLQEIQLISKKEKETLIYRFNDTAAPFYYPRDKRVHRLFEEQAARTPDNIAVAAPFSIKYRTYIIHMTHISYRELNEKTRQLALLLKEKGAQPDTIVALLVERGIEMIISILGILKAGSAYLPLAPEYPIERISYMLNDSNTKFLVTTPGLAEKFKKLSIVNYQLLMVNEEPTGCPVFNIPPKEANSINNYQLTIYNLQLEWNNLAYIIYTSGTTGRPKGVMVAHGNLLGYLEAFEKEFQLQANDTVIQQVTYVFDAFVEELYPILLKGGKLVIAAREVILDSRWLVDFINRHNISVITCSPRLLDQLNREQAENNDSLPGLRILISGGDRLENQYIDYLVQIGKVYNTYGPTETTVCAAYYHCPANAALHANVPIGTPITNYRVYILDQYGNLLPPGLAGELCIAGRGVTRGYLNNPELTDEKFKRAVISHWSLVISSSKDTNDQCPMTNDRLYRTGDMAKWLPDGNILFIGRIDKQVKIRGFRIELEEIQSRLLKHHQIKQAVVIDREDAFGDKYLCAYVVTDGPKEELASYLSRWLPEYMVPSFFVPVERIPLTPSGKVDRTKLPEPAVTEKEALITPRNKIEEKLRETWSQVLGILPSSIGINHHFFKLGGHSLKATTLVSRIKRELDIHMPLVEVFNRPTIRQQAQYIREQTNKNIPIKNPHLVLLKEQKNKKNHLFLVHDGSGEVDAYIEFCNSLKSAANCWGIKVHGFENYTPQNITIENLAQKYIQVLHQVQNSHPYHISGWSLGGIIAFEMVRQLERKNRKVHLFALIDSPLPNRDLVKPAEEFSQQNELDFVKNYLPADIYEKIKNAAQPGHLWQLILRQLEIKNVGVKEIKEIIAQLGGQGIANFEHLTISESIRYLNILRSFARSRAHYIPKGKINTAIHYFKASESKQIKHENWKHYTRQSTTFYEIQGDHYSIFQPPRVTDFARKFDQILKIK
jgi:amino acid adenylation domain-containing protein